MESILPKVSVIVPIYGVEDYIEECATTLFEQTLDDIEFIFVNDCTLDKSMEILERTIEKFPKRKKNIVIINNEKNLGQFGARRKGIEAATGEYIIHCDPDDWVEPVMYEVLYDKAITENSDHVFCQFYYNFENGEQKEQIHSLEERTIESLKELLIPQRRGALWLQIVSSKIAKSNDIVWPSWNYSEDFFLVFQYILQSKKIVCLNECLYHYRIRENSISYNKEKSKERVLGLSNSLSCIYNMLNRDLHKQLDSYIFGYQFNVKARAIQSYDKTKDREKAWFEIAPERNFWDLIKARMTLKDKIVALCFFLKIYPFFRFFRK